MVAPGEVSRLRVTGVAAVIAMCLVALANLGVLEWRSSVSRSQVATISQIAAGRAAVTNVLYAAAVARPRETGALHDSIAALQSSAPAFVLFAGAGASLEGFLQSARAVERAPSDAALQATLVARGRSLIASYQAASDLYLARDSRQRAFVREILVLSSGVMIVGLLLMYVLVMRRRDRLLDAAMAELEERRQRFAAMFDNTTEMMALYDVDGRIVRANRAALDRLGYGTEAVGQHFAVHVAPDDREAALRAFAQAARGEANEFAARFLDANETPLSVLANLAPVIVSGRIVGVVGAARDVEAERAFEDGLLRSRERFRALFELSPSAMLTIKLDGTISEINVAMERMSGYRNEDVIGKSAGMLAPARRRDLAASRIAEFAALRGPMHYETIIAAKDGRDIPVQVDVSPIRVLNAIEGHFVVLRDLTNERALERSLGEKDQRLGALYRVASSANRAELQISEALAFGAQSLSMGYGMVTEVSGADFVVRHRYGPDDIMPVGFRTQLTRAIGLRLAASARAVAVDDLSQDAYRDELRVAELPWQSYIGSRISVDGDPYGAMIFLDRHPRAHPFNQSDIDFIDLLSALVTGAVARELDSERLRQRASHDPLTGLANKRLVEEFVARSIARAKRSKRGFAVHFVDLDRFKPVNDQLGHAAGDAVLCEVARRLVAAIRAEDLVGRVGGDEFVIVETDVEGERATFELVSRIERSLAEPIDEAADTVLGCSVGTAIFPRDGETPAEIIAAADAAMYREKHGREQEATSP